MAQCPPFCPNSACANHRTALVKNWYKPFGYYTTQAYGRVKRYACLRCGKSFSEQTFRLSYYLHKKISFRDIVYRISACSGIRAMARWYQVTDKVISNRIGRLARQVMGLMAEMRAYQDFREDLVADGFESFIHSQYSPNNIQYSY